MINLPQAAEAVADDPRFAGYDTDSWDFVHAELVEKHGPDRADMIWELACSIQLARETQTHYDLEDEEFWNDPENQAFLEADDA